MARVLHSYKLALLLSIVVVSLQRVEAEAETCPEAQQIDILSDSPDRNLDLIALYEKYCGMGLNKTQLDLLDINERIWLYSPTTDSCVLQVTCDKLLLSLGENSVLIDRRMGLVRYCKLDAYYVVKPGNKPVVTEADALSIASQIVAVSNSYVRPPDFQLRVEGGKIMVSFVFAEHLPYRGSLSIDASSGRILYFHTVLLEKLNVFNEKISSAEAERIAVNYLDKRGFHRPEVHGETVLSYSYPERQSAKGYHDCETFRAEPRYVWAVETRPHITWGLDHLAMFSDNTTGHRLWLGKFENASVAVDIETGEVLQGP